MDRNQQNRRKKSGAASHAAKHSRSGKTMRTHRQTSPNRGLGTRVGLEKRRQAESTASGSPDFPEFFVSAATAAGRQLSPPALAAATAGTTPPPAGANPPHQVPPQPAAHRTGHICQP